MGPELLTAALAPTIQRYALTSTQAEQIGTLVGRLHEDEHAPTAIREIPAIVDQHIADSLVALELDAVRNARTITDVGAGAGLPGLALAAGNPTSRVALLEAHQRKCDYMTDVIAAMGLPNATSVCSRAEDWQEGRGGSDVVLARAIAPQAVVLEYAAPLLRLGGVLVDWRGRRLEDEEASAIRAATELGLARLEVRHVVPYAGARDHHLHVYVKDAETPERFPRRAGMARKRPLGAAS
jgi:16S rRNA (guanine527-N7)-methyltransferase